MVVERLTELRPLVLKCGVRSNIYSQELVSPRLHRHDVPVSGCGCVDMNVEWWVERVRLSTRKEMLCVKVRERVRVCVCECVETTVQVSRE